MYSTCKTTATASLKIDMLHLVLEEMKNDPSDSESTKKAAYFLAARIPKQIDPDEKISSITEIYNKLDIRKLTESRIKDFYQAALASLERLNRPSERKEELFNFASYLMHRQK